MLNALKVDFAADYAAAEPAFEGLVRRELERLTSEVPPAELAIQWDVCYEVQDIEGVVAWMGGGDAAWERFTGPVGRLARLVPEEVLVGYHFCYGTFPEWPMYEARDMGLLVRMANYAVAALGPRGRLGASRRAPLPAQRGQALLRAACRPGHPPDTRIYLGIVLPLDGIPGGEAPVRNGVEVPERVRGRDVLRVRPATGRGRPRDDASAPRDRPGGSGADVGAPLTAAGRLYIWPMM